MAENKEENKRKFEGIWIPAEIWLSKELTIQEKVFFVEIKSLDNKKGCFATNEYFSNFFGLSKVRVSEVISSLIFKGYILSEIDKSKGNKRVLRVNKRKLSSIKPSHDSLLKPSLRPSKRKVKEPIKEAFTSENNSSSNSSSSPMNEGKSVVTDTSPLESETNLSEIPTGSEHYGTPPNLSFEKEKNDFYENLTAELKNEAANLKKEVESLKEKTLQKKANSGGGGEKNVSSVDKLDLDKDIAPLGMNDEKLDFIFLEASRIDTSEIRAKFTMWHERRARKTRGVRNCLHYQKIMRLVANSDLSESEVIEGLNMAYEKTWTGLEIEWIKNKTRQNKTQQNGTNNRLEQQKQYIADSPFFKGA